MIDTGALISLEELTLLAFIIIIIVIVVIVVSYINFLPATHGTGIGFGNMATLVTGVEFVNGRGEVWSVGWKHMLIFPLYLICLSSLFFPPRSFLPLSFPFLSPLLLLLRPSSSTLQLSHPISSLPPPPPPPLSLLVSPDNNPDLFRAAQVSIGMLGTLTKVTFE